jgi:hypothetical protein
MHSAGSPHVLSGHGANLGPVELKALQAFLNVADGISRSLAADSLDELRQCIVNLPDASSSLTKAFADDHPWLPILQRIEAASHWPVPEDLAVARESFLGFSTNVVELVQRVRAQEESLRSLKVFFCPMAPKPGLWFQAKGPLRNPYYGAEMLLCGDEVRRPTFPLPDPPRMETAALHAAAAPLPSKRKRHQPPRHQFRLPVCRWMRPMNPCQPTSRSPRNGGSTVWNRATNGGRSKKCEPSGGRPSQRRTPKTSLDESSER